MGHVKSYPYYNLHQYLQMNKFSNNNSSIVLQYMDESKKFKILLYLLEWYYFALLGISPYLSYIIFMKKI